jgi:streptomycin 6-kinase
VTVPADLPVVVSLGHIPAARDWLAGLPDLIAQVRDEFQLRLAPPLYGGSCSWVAPAELPDGTRVIVKIGWPHREMYGEPTALRLWGGRGAVRLVAHYRQRHALLLERCEPGTELARSTEPTADRLRAGCAVLRRLWSAPLPGSGDGSGGTGSGAAGSGDGGGGIEWVADVTAEWADLVDERMDRLRPGYDPGLVAEGAALLRTLSGSAARTVVLHGDFNPGNVLAAGGGRWLAIDPKPMLGDPAYDPWPLLEQVDDPFAHPDPVPVLRDRVALLSDELDLDAGRIVRWAVARGVETALWAANHDDVPGGAEALAQARALARII